MQRRTITIMSCDDVPEPDRSRHGDVHEQVSKHLAAVQPHLGFELEVQVVDARESDLPGRNHRTDLYLFTGSAAAPFDDDPWIARLRDWITDAHEHRSRMYGICFGHQIIAHALGGETGRASDWEVGVVRMRQHLKLLPGAQLAPIDEPSAPSSVGLLMSHQDEVKRLPSGAQRWLQGDFCSEQGMVIAGRVVTVQGHPEYWTAQISDLYERRRTTLGAARTDNAQRSAAQPHDGLAITIEALRHLLLD